MRRGHRVLADIVAIAFIISGFILAPTAGASPSTGLAKTLPIADQEQPILSSPLVFTSQKFGWLLLDNKVLRTSDGGTTWKDAYSGHFQPTLIDAVNANDAWMLAYRNLSGGRSKPIGLIWTVDGGRTWNTLGEPTHTELFDVDFLDASNGYALTLTGNLLETDNAGRSWREMGTPGQVGAVCATASRTLWIGTAAGHVYKQARGETHWSEVLAYAKYAPGPDAGGTYLIHPLLSCAGHSAIALYDWGESAGSAMYEAMVTVDGGVNWGLKFATWQTAAAAKDIPAVSGTPDVFADTSSSSAWILAYCGPCESGGTVRLATTVNGTIWKVRSVPASVAVLDASFVNAQDGWIVCTPPRSGPYRRAEVLATTNSGRTWRRISTLPVNIG